MSLLLEKIAQQIASDDPVPLPSVPKRSREHEPDDRISPQRGRPDCLSKGHHQGTSMLCCGHPSTAGGSLPLSQSHLQQKVNPHSSDLREAEVPESEAVRLAIYYPDAISVFVVLKYPKPMSHGL